MNNSWSKLCSGVNATNCFLSFVLQGIMLVYDITNEKSFDNIRNWIRNIEEVGPAPLTSHDNMLSVDDQLNV